MLFPRSLEVSPLRSRLPHVAVPDGLILLAAFAVSTPASAQISGTVTEAGSGVPVAGARVSLQATVEQDTTASDGTFDLPGATGATLRIVAAKKGYYNGSTVVSSPANVAISLTPVPADDDPSYTFIAPTSCAACHPDQHAQWNESPMQRAGQNTWVYDIYDGSGTSGGSGGFVYTRDSVHASSNPESECASCHQPQPWIEDPYRALEDIGDLSSGALHGVSCEVCHKIANVDESKPNFPGIWPGVVTFTRPSSSANQVEYGVLDADYEAPGIMRPSFQPQLTAVVCAACHQDKNDPDGDGDFEESDGVISEPTYLEWLASPYGDPVSSLYTTCVECHMPAYGAEYACVVGGPTRDPDTI